MIELYKAGFLGSASLLGAAVVPVARFLLHGAVSEWIAVVDSKHHLVAELEAVINVQRSSGAAPTPTVVLSSKDAKAAASVGVARAGDVPANELYLSAIGDGGGALGESTAFYDGDWKTVSGNWKEFSVDQLKFEGVGEPSGARISGGPAFVQLLQHEMEVCKKWGLVVGCACGGDGAVVHLAIDVSHLAVRSADACGIDRQQPLVVRFEWQEPTHYMGACPSPARHTLEVRQSRDAGALDGRARLASWSQFGLWWTLEQRIAEHLQSGWQRYAGAAQQVAERVKREVELLTPQVRDILDMFEWPFTDRALVERALALANGDADAALNLLFDDARERELRAELGPAPTAAGSAVAAKLTLDKADSIYWATVEFVRATLVDIAKRCVICNAPHALELQKPTICANQLCSFQFTSLGLGVDVERELQRAPEVVDLLICFTAAGTLQPERFSPFPDVQRRVAGHEMSFAQNHADLSAALCRLPPVAEMAALAARAPGALRAHLDALHPLLYLALRWIVSTTLAHLERLADHTAPPRWPRLGAHQFIMRCATPAREAQFRDHCRKHGGSFFVWHGSGLGNWHNIVRSGLKNMSGTAMQSTGAAYGAGTYASHDSAISFSYSGNTSNPWSNTMFGVGARTLALCEVVDHGSKLLCLGKVHRPGCIHSPSSPYYRVEDDEFIATRFFIVFMNNEGTASVDAKDAYEFFSKYLKE